MAITTNIKNYPAAHGKNESGGGGTTIIMGGGNANIPADLNVTSINADRGDISLLNGKSMTFNDGQFIYLGANNGTVNKITGDELKYAYGEFGEIHPDKILGAKEIETDSLNAVKAWIEALNSKSITTEYLTVTKQAHFFELVIDKIKSVGGQMIMTAANCVVDYAKAVDANGDYLSNLDDANAKAYDIFWLSTDASGRAVTNDWQVNDQAICQSFNNASTGASYDVSNKYYWRLVTNILPDRYMNLSTGAELSLGQSQQATVNSVTITAPYIANTDDTRLDTGWHTQAQQITGVITGATWTETSGGAGEQTIGTMTTTNTVFGIQITPVEGEVSGTVNANYFGFTCTPARLNVGIYYTDGTSQYFVAPEQLQTSYRYETLTQVPIEAIVITNAEEVEWKLVHGIRLSNTDCATMINGYASIPSAGDNVIQLGYRYNQYQETDEEYDIPRSSAIIIAAYHTPDSGLTPPSYAQYTKITDYNLSSHRQTYIDANGSRFVGDFYVDANTSIQDLIDEAAHTQYYLHIAYANSADGQTGFTKTPVSGVSYSYMGYCSNSTESDASLTYTDYQWSYVPGGTNGGRYIMLYKNATSTPTVPNGTNSYSETTLKNNYGWSNTPAAPDLSQNEYTYMTQAFFADGQTSAVWSTPIRITGENGQAGEDGKYTEFIYKRFTSAQTWGNNNSNPAYWNASQTEDYLGPTGYEWSDNPQGTTSTYLYEYVSTREFDGTTFGTFTTPVIWSKWGEKGQDGDGYEYIYKIFDSEQTFGNNNNNPAYWTASQTDDYLGPSGYQWSDDPQSVTSTYKFQYCAVRKRTNGTWGTFSTPTIWGTYSIGETGPQGPRGPQGNDGNDGNDGQPTQVYRLIDNGSQANVRMSLDSNNNVAEELVISLNYKVAKFVGGTVTFMTYNELVNFPAEFGSSNGLYAYVKYTESTTETPTYYWYRLTLNTDGTLTYSYTSTNSNTVRNNPTIEVRLIPYNSTTITTSSLGLNYTKDSVFVPITLLPNAAFQVVQGDHASIATLVTGQQGNTQAISSLRQDMNSISSTVTTIEGNYVSQSELEQTAEGITSTVLETVRKEIDYKVEQIVDLTELDLNKFYPISIQLCSDASLSSWSQSNDRVRIVIDRSLDYDTFGEISSDISMTPNTYGMHATDKGFDAVLDYTTQASGWGATWHGIDGTNTTWAKNELNGQGYDTYRFINNYLVNWTQDQSYNTSSGTITIPNNAIFGSIRQNGFCSTEIVYARGGSKYRVRTDWAYAKIYKHPTGYEWSYSNASRTAPVITWTNDNSLIIPVKDQMQKSEILQTATNIQLNVYDQLKEKTGIDISSGQIILDADNTIINGSVKINNASDGVIVFNESGQKAVEIVKDSIGTFGTQQNTGLTEYNVPNIQTWTWNKTTGAIISSFDTSVGYTEKWQSTNGNQLAWLGSINNGTSVVIPQNGFRFEMTGFYGKYDPWAAGVYYEGFAGKNTLTDGPYQFKLSLFSYNDGNDIEMSTTGWQYAYYNSSMNAFTFATAKTLTANRDGNAYIKVFFKGNTPTIGSTTNKYKKLNFATYLTVSTSISTNTKIGIDGLRTNTDHGALWVNENRINATYVDGNVQLGSIGSVSTPGNWDSYGIDINDKGVFYCFGNDLNSLRMYGDYKPMIWLAGGTTTNVGYSISDTAAYWRTSTGSSANTCYFDWTNVKDTIKCYPAIIYITGVGNTYYRNFICLGERGSISGTSYDIYPPKGICVNIINKSTQIVYVGSTIASGSSVTASGWAGFKFDNDLFGDSDTTSTGRFGVINPGDSCTYVHVGQGKWMIYSSSDNIDVHRSSSQTSWD